MSFAAIDRDIAYLRRRIHARRVAEPISNHWNPQEPPDPFHVGQRFTDVGCRSFAFANFYSYLNQAIRKGEVPNPITMVRKLLPYAWDHRYDNFFAFDLPPRKPLYPCPNLPAWV